MSTEKKINEEIDEEGDASSVLDFRAAEWRNEAAKAYDRRDFGPLTDATPPPGGEGE